MPYVFLPGFHPYPRITSRIIKPEPVRKNGRTTLSPVPNPGVIIYLAFDIQVSSDVFDAVGVIAKQLFSGKKLCARSLR
jgi:hypothetical protein